MSFNLWNQVQEELKLLMVAIVGFLKSSLIAALLKLCLMHQWPDPYSSSQEHSDHGSISSLKISKHSFLIGLPVRRLPQCGVPWIRVRTGGCSVSIPWLLLWASVSLESSSEEWRKGLWYYSGMNGSRILLCSIAKPSSGSCLADTYIILAVW